MINSSYLTRQILCDFEKKKNRTIHCSYPEVRSEKKKSLEEFYPITCVPIGALLT